MKRLPRIFISYRRDDSAFQTTAIHAQLVPEFGAEHVFMDVDNIPLGVNFVVHLEKAVEQCDVCIAVIGDDWLTASNAPDTRRLDAEQDWVRIEIEAALRRGIPVIPLLVGKRTERAPKADDLPPTMSELASRQAHRIRTGRDFGNDIQALVEELRKVEGNGRSLATRRDAVVGVVRKPFAPLAHPLQRVFAFTDRWLGRVAKFVTARSIGVSLLLMAAVHAIVELLRGSLTAEDVTLPSLEFRLTLPLRWVLYACLGAWLLLRAQKLLAGAWPRLRSSAREFTAIAAVSVGVELLLRAAPLSPLAGEYYDGLLIEVAPTLAALVGVWVARRVRGPTAAVALTCAVLVFVVYGANEWLALEIETMDLLHTFVRVGGMVLLVRKLPELPSAVDRTSGAARRWQWCAQRCVATGALGALALSWATHSSETTIASTVWAQIQVWSVVLVVLLTGFALVALVLSLSRAVLRRTRLAKHNHGPWLVLHVAALFTVFVTYMVCEAVWTFRPAATDDDSAFGFALEQLYWTCRSIQLALVPAIVGFFVMQYRGFGGWLGRSESARRALGGLVAMLAGVLYATRFEAGHVEPGSWAHSAVWALICYWSLGLFSYTPWSFRIGRVRSPMADIVVNRLRVHCHECDAILSVNRESLGSRGRCPKCGAVVLLEEEEYDESEDDDSEYDESADDEADEHAMGSEEEVTGSLDDDRVSKGPATSPS